MDNNVNDNFLNSKWWQTAMPKDVAAEIEKGADVLVAGSYVFKGDMDANISKVEKMCEEN